MPPTRSSSRVAARAATVSSGEPETPHEISPKAKPARTSSSTKKRAPPASEPSPSISTILPTIKRPRTTKPKTPKPPPLHELETEFPSAPRAPIILPADATVIPAQLSFDFEEAKAHLIGVDGRFEHMFETVRCKPFEALEPLDPFKSLVMSILGQQISWLAARSISHKFLRLFDPSLPVSPPEAGDDPIEFFPSAKEVSDSSIEKLRTAGLSQRKAEYIKDLAERFADGRLSAAKLAMWNEQEVSENLIAVRGIGPWTVHMFSMFSLRQPDVLGVGDLGLQKGLLRWVISSHTGTSPSATIHTPGSTLAIEPKKLKKQPKVEAAIEPDAAEPVPAQDASTLPPVPSLSSSQSQPTLPSNTPSTAPKNGLIADKPVPLPEGLTLATLKARLNGSKIKGNYLTPEEMYALTRSWRPYRSLGCYYLWALAEGE